MDNKQATLELGTKPVGKLLMQYALPAIIAMTASSLYNMVDSIFIGQCVGALAISGLALTFPLMNLSAAFGAAIGVGASTMLSVRLGQKDYNTAERILGNTVVLNAIVGIAFAVVTLALLDPILYFFGASENTISYARDYMVIIILGNIITHEYFGLNAILRAASKPKMAMYATIFTVVLNCVLDPLFIWVLDMGIRGAALATVLSQAAALIWQLRSLSDKREMLHFKHGTYRLRGYIIKNIFAIGISPFVMNACACIVVIFINNGLATHGGDLAVGAYGIVNKMAFVFVMIVMGINQGMQPIAGYNYGAMQLDRMMKSVKLSMIAATMITTGGFLIAQLLPYPCVRLFTSDTTLIYYSIRGLRITLAAFPIVGYQMVITNFFQSIGMAKISIFLSLSRQLIFLIPMLAVLPSFWGADGIWMSQPISDTLAAAMAGIMMMIYMRRFKRQHRELEMKN